jgi:hypothetical protein
MVAASAAERAYGAAARSALAALERNLIPDAVTRRLTRLLLAQRLRQGYLPSAPLQLQQLLYFVHCEYQLTDGRGRKETNNKDETVATVAAISWLIAP